ncbi:MAG TPA: hypothetical protein VIU39_11750 [Anaerolineales bacterium]
MSTHRSFNVLLAVALLVIIALTVWQSLETARVVRAASAEHSLAAEAAYCVSAAQRASLTSVYVKESNAWYARIGGRPTGVDGGLLATLSGQRGCSQ